jgi:hypothetical protein
MICPYIHIILINISNKKLLSFYIYIDYILYMIRDFQRNRTNNMCVHHIVIQIYRKRSIIKDLLMWLWGQDVTWSAVCKLETQECPWYSFSSSLRTRWVNCVSSKIRVQIPKKEAKNTNVPAQKERAKLQTHQPLLFCSIQRLKLIGCFLLTLLTVIFLKTWYDLMWCDVMLRYLIFLILY